MSLTTLPTVFCTKCGRALEHFFSEENKEWFIAHSQLKDLREKIRCEDGKKVWKVPTIELKEVNI